MAQAFRHEALIYADHDEFLAGTVPFLREGLEAGDRTLVALGPVKTALLEGELGVDGAEIFFADMEEIGRNPGRLIPYWREVFEDHPGATVRGLGEPLWSGRREPEVEECQRHESLLNLAFERAPAWLLCPYDGGALADEILEQVTHSHQRVVRDGLVEPGTGFLTPDHYLTGTLPRHPDTAEEFEFDLDGLAEVRRRVEAIGVFAGLMPLHASDLVVAASELAANSIAHGGGSGTLRIWMETERVIVEVEDRGEIVDPLVGRIKPVITQEGGRGLWLANQLCDLVQIRTGANGTVVRLHMAIV